MYGGHRRGADGAGGHNGDAFDTRGVGIGEEDSQQGNGGSSQLQNGHEEAPLHPINQGAEVGSRGTDFSVQRLLPPPITFLQQPVQNGINHSPTATDESTSDHTDLQTVHHAHGSYPLEPLGPQNWVGYGNPYYPSFSTYQGAGMSKQRWPNHHVYPAYAMPPYIHNSSVTPPSPFTDPPSTPTLHHDAASSSPDCEPSPQPSNTNSMQLFHPANEGLYTLCQAAMISSNHEGYNHPPPPNQQPSLMGTLPRPPPPYYHHHHLQTSSNPLHSQLSPDSPQPPAYPHQMQQTNGMVQGDLEQQSGGGEPPFVAHGITNGLVGDGEQPGPSYLNQVPNNNISPAVDDPEQHDTLSFIDHVPMSASAAAQDDSVAHTEEELAAVASLPAVQQDDEGQTESDLTAVMMDDLTAPQPEGQSSSKKSKSKRTRTAFSQVQQDKLELAYHVNPYPDGFFRQQVSQDVGIPEDRIQVWFQNRRARGKKQARTGSISYRSKFRHQRLIANLTRQQVALAAVGQGVSPGLGLHRYNLNGDSHGSHMQEHQAPSDNGENGLQTPSTLPSPNLQSTTAAGLPMFSAPHTLTAPAAVDSVPTSDAAQNTNSLAPLPPSLPSSAPINRPLPPAYHHTAGSSTICYLPQPSTTPPITPHRPDPSPENNHTQPAMTLPTNPVTAMYFFPPPPPIPHIPPAPSFPQPLIHPSLPHPYQPMAIPLHQPRSPPPFLPPLSATTGPSSASSSSPSPNHTVSPQVTSINSHYSEESAQDHSPDQDSFTGI